jgi:hypothetical protein
MITDSQHMIPDMMLSLLMLYLSLNVSKTLSIVVYPIGKITLSLLSKLIKRYSL